MLKSRKEILSITLILVWILLWQRRSLIDCLTESSNIVVGFDQFQYVRGAVSHAEICERCPGCIVKIYECMMDRSSEVRCVNGKLLVAAIEGRDR